MSEPLVYERAVVLFGIEATAGVAETLDPATQALLVDQPDYTADPQKIERTFSKADMSPFAFRIGRKLGMIKFDYELRGNGKQKSGNIADAPLLAQLIRACGFNLAPALAPADRVGPIYPELGNIGQASWVGSGALTLTEPAMYTLVCTTPGNAAAAKFTVSCNNKTIMANPATDVVASAPIALTGSGATIAPTITTNMAVGDTFRVLVTPPGVKLSPISTGFKTATLDVYLDGLHHRLTGAVGTFSFSADAGGVGKFSFTFSGVHNTPDDVAMPNAVYDEILPPLFQDALLTWGSKQDLVIGSMSFDLGGTSNPRDDANHPKGYRGFQYTGRAPTGGFTPEATLEADNPFWGEFEAATQKYFMARVGLEQGNSFLIEGPRVQTSALKYTDRNSNRAYDQSLGFARFKGNDEVRFFFF